MATTYAVLLRGINVGGKNKLAMPRLRQVLADAGHAAVRTYVQSGNVVLESKAKPAALAAAIHDRIASSFGLDIAVVVRSASELADIAAHNPFLRPDADPSRNLHVAFLESTPAAGAAAKLDPHRAAPDELHLRGREIYLWCPEGMGRSKVMIGVERLLATSATVRNWRTVTELVRLSAAR